MARGATVATAATIAALSSPPGPAARGVMRVSGPDAAALAWATLRVPADPGRPLSRAAPRAEEETVRLRAALARRGVFRARFDDGLGTQPVLVLWMPGPASYTREDVLELHLPGAPALLDAALARLLALGARRAERGEFTRRAFTHGRLDLTRAEGVLELVSASTEAEARAAAELLRGGLAARVALIRDALEELRALAEASLDFDEADTGHVPVEQLAQALAGCRSRLVEALGWEVRRQPPTALPRVVLVGVPNAGKSTLFNALTGDAGSLVSDHAGTTRDLLTGLWRLAPPAGDAPGPTVLLIDTAGEDPGAAGVDREAQAFAARAAAEADLLLHLVPAGAGAVPAPRPFGTEAVPVLRLRSKADLGPDRPSGAGGVDADGELWIAAAEGRGLAALAARVAAELGLGGGSGGGAPAPAAGAAVDRAPSGASRARDAGTGQGLGRELFARHRAALEAAHAAVARAAEELDQGAPLDLLAEALREASEALDQVEGRTTPEDLLDRIFARFCLGK